jgi:hypothetical protein
MDENALYETASFCETPKLKFMKTKRHCFEAKHHALKQRRRRRGRRLRLVGGERQAGHP